ncbi:unnamed protein product, partial [marine sediment metagenome]
MYQGKYSAVDINNTGKPVTVGGTGNIVENSDGSPVLFSEFVELIRREIPEAKAKPVPDRKTVPDHLKKYVIQDLPTKNYDRSEPSHVPEDIRPPLSAPDSDNPKNPAQHSGQSSLSRTDDGIPFSRSTDRWSYEHRAKNVPIVYNPLPDDGGLISLHDQYQMSYWNTYADIYQVMTATGNWAWENGRYDQAGFVNNATMIAQFGEGWGATTLAVCWSRWDYTGFSIEADIAMNPAYSWTVNDYSTYYNSNLFNADRTLLHEIGHSWGLQHQWTTLSVMNYAP